MADYAKSKGYLFILLLYFFVFTIPVDRVFAIEDIILSDKNDIYSKFISFTSKDGLGSNTVLDIIQDKYGVMWFATIDGLNRLDGSEFTVFRHNTDNVGSISSNTITCLAEDVYGNLWVGTDNGLNRYIRNTGNFIRYLNNDSRNCIKGNNIRALLADKEGRLWIEIKGGFCDVLDIKQAKFIHLSHSSGSFEGDYFYHQIVEDSKKNIWICGRNLHPLIIEGSHPFKTIQNISSSSDKYLETTCFVETKDHRLFGFCNEKKIVEYNYKNKIFEEHEKLTLPFSPYAAISDNRGRIWTGGRGGYAGCIDLKEKTIVLYSNNTLNPQSIISTNINTIYNDMSGNIWFGTDKGVSVYSEKLNSFRHYRQIPGVESCMTTNHVTALLQNQNGLLWVGTEDSGVDTVSLKYESFKNISYSLLCKSISKETFEREKDLLYHYSKQGLIKLINGDLPDKSVFNDYRKFLKTNLVFANINENKVSALYQDKRGKIYIGLFSGIGFNIYDKSFDKIKRYCLLGEIPGFTSMFIGSPWGSNWFTGFFEDNKSRLWCSTWETFGLNLFNRDKGIFEAQHYMPANRPDNGIHSFWMDKKKNRMWMCGYKYFGYYDFKYKNFHRYSPKIPDNQYYSEIYKEYYKYSKTKQINLPSYFNSYKLLPDNENKLWISTEKGLVRFDIETEKVNIFNKKSRGGNLISDSIAAMYLSDDGKYLWLASDKGIERMQKSNGKTTFVENSDSLGRVNCMISFKDRLFVGTDKGLYQLSLKKPSIVKSGIIKPFEIITAFCIDRVGNLYAGSVQGLYIINEEMKTSKVIPYGDVAGYGLPGNRILDIFVDSDNDIWVSTNDGIALIDGNYKIKIFRANINMPGLHQSSLTDGISEAAGKNIWISTENGICVYNKVNEKFTDLCEAGNDCLTSRLVSCIIQDKYGLIWVGTTEAGLNAINTESGEILHFQNRSYDKKSISSNHVTCLYEDKKGELWIGTINGLNRYDNATRGFVRITTKEGLPGNNIKSIQEDKNGNIWLGTDKGLCCYDYGHSKFLTFLSFHGLQDDEFSSAACTLENGDLAFGGNYGFNVFCPDSVTKKWKGDRIILYDFRIGDSLFQYDVNGNSRIVLGYKNNSFSVLFSPSNPIFRKNLSYRYRLDGFEDEWTYCRYPNFLIKYNRIPHGKYKLEVECSNPMNEWNGNASILNIIIQTPWFLQWWFLLVSFLFFAIFFLGIIRLRERKLLREKELLGKKVEERTLDLIESNRNLKISEENLSKAIAAKDKFFSIISHDLRNPSQSISQLSGLLSDRFDKMDNKKLGELLRLLSDTSRHNYELIEKLLLWSRSQNQDFPVNKSFFDISDIVLSGISDLSGFSEIKKIKIKTSFKHQSAVFADKNMIETVFRNILNNSIKFSYEDGLVTVETSENENFIIVRVIDKGFGIDSSFVDKLFDLSCRMIEEGTNGEKGSGLGLILCSEFITINNGRIYAQSEKNKGTIITFELPKQNNN